MSVQPSPPETADLIRRLEARLARERSARHQAEALLEEKSRALYLANQSLQGVADALEKRVTERTIELNQALQEAQSAIAAKSRFLALMSHEIRTPLNGVLGLTELLGKTELGPQQSNYVANVIRAGSTLLRLLNDILDFSKMEAGQLQLETLPVDPVDLVRETLQLLRPQADAKGIQLTMVCSPMLPARIMTDAIRLRQVWLNLISNAIKFTEKGGVTVTLAAVGSQLFCSVEDSGIGMSELTVKGLFEPFRQADNTMARRYGGTGLGLVICKTLITQMGGQLRVSSAQGQGSRFEFELPINETPESVPHRNGTGGGTDLSAMAPDAKDTSRLATLRLLLVGDQAINRLVTRSQLRQFGCDHVDEAENGILALSQLQREHYDVVLMDMQMPEMDGLEATRQLRLLPLPRQPVVIAVTANAFPEDRAACLDAGMDHFISKPASLEQLRSALLACLL